jgi:atypical dual specificity phosphatase
VAKGVSYEKIFVPGRTIPPRDLVVKFMSAVQDFLAANPDKYVAIHCTHGVNRTGFFIISVNIRLGCMAHAFL